MKKLIKFGATALFIGNVCMAGNISEKHFAMPTPSSSELPDGHFATKRKCLDVKGVKDTEIEVAFKTKKAQKVVVEVFDENGKKIKTRTFTKAGIHQVKFLGEEDKNYKIMVASGGIVVVQNKTL